MRKRELIDKLCACATLQRAEHDRNYIGTRFILLGCTIPDIRKITNKFFVESKKSHEQMRKDMNTLWKESDIHEILNVPLFYFQSRKGKNDLSDWNILKEWVKKIDNWAHSDYLSNILSDLLERFPEEIYPTIKKWNNSQKPWFRRQSLTNLLYYARQRENPLPLKKILPLIKTSLDDQDPFVQKAVGWQLRECYNLWPKKTEYFVNTHAEKLSGTAFSYSTEKWPAKKKEVLKRVRAKSRKK